MIILVLPGSYDMGCAVWGEYLDGYDAVYQYTPSEDGIINIAMSALGSNNMGVFVYEDCVDIGSECVAGYGNATHSSEYFNMDVQVSAGTTYYVLLSTIEEHPSTTYTLDITELECDKPIELAASPLSTTEASVSWNAGGSDAAWNFEYGLTGYILGTGTSGTVNGSADLNLNALTPGETYDIYIQNRLRSQSKSLGFNFLETTIGWRYV